MVPKAPSHALQGNTKCDVQSKARWEGRGGKGGQVLVVEMQASPQPRGVREPQDAPRLSFCTLLRHRNSPQAVGLRAGPPPSTLRLTPRVSLLPPCCRPQAGDLYQTQGSRRSRPGRGSMLVFRRSHFWEKTAPELNFSSTGLVNDPQRLQS